MDKIKRYAKTVYFQDVKNESMRKNFVENLQKMPVIDKRDCGFFCSYCECFLKDMQMGNAEERVIFIGEDEMWIIKPHYDGCRGWD